MAWILQATPGWYDSCRLRQAGMSFASANGVPWEKCSDINRLGGGRRKKKRNR